MKYLGVLVALLFTVISISAQSDMVSNLKKHRAGEGKVSIYQDIRLEKLLGRPLEVQNTAEEGEKQTMKMAGFRVQVYAGNNSRTARNEANAMAVKVKEQFPDLAVYTHFVNPRWLCRVGDFRSIEEADAVMRKLKDTGMFKEVSIVRGQINIPY